ncbi:DUF2256 domain-containing protein [Muriicola sp.]|uniref:DUF2256 domain-containing protein n=1 Tax=Muriicola sp. TaxID=2020856 RepID=UPI003C76FEEE
MGHNKQQLPAKLCVVCGRPFLWRKKWEKNWEHVIYCSERCRRNKHQRPRTEVKTS